VEKPTTGNDNKEARKIYLMFYTSTPLQQQIFYCISNYKVRFLWDMNGNACNAIVIFKLKSVWICLL